MSEETSSSGQCEGGDSAHLDSLEGAVQVYTRWKKQWSSRQGGRGDGGFMDRVDEEIMQYWKFFWRRRHCFSIAGIWKNRLLFVFPRHKIHRRPGYSIVSLLPSVLHPPPPTYLPGWYEERTSSLPTALWKKFWWSNLTITPEYKQKDTQCSLSALPHGSVASLWFSPHHHHA